MKNIFLFALMSFATFSCADNTSGHATAGADSSTSNTESSVNETGSGINSSTDTGAVQGKGTGRIPSRTGATGQGNTIVTGSATGSPTGAKDTTVK